MTDVTAGPALPLPAGLPNAGAPVPGVVTAGQPSAAQLEALARAGLQVVADLRGPGEDRGFDEPAAAARLQLEYHSIPVTGPTLVARDLDALRALLRERGTRPVLVHCKSANRVGGALIPWLILDEHRSPEEALRIAQEVGLRSEELARSAFAYVAAHSGQR